MPFQMKVDGMAEISEILGRMEQEAPKVAAQALYKGSAIVRDEIFSEMHKIKTAPFKYAKAGEMRLPSPEEKDVLLEAGVGIAKFDKNGIEIDTSVGFNGSGYADVNFNHMSSAARTNYKAQSFKGMENMTTSTLKAAGTYRKGVQNRKPIGVIANAINSGTSFMKKQPFVRKAARSGAPKAMAAMKATIEEAFEALSEK